jgi:hypothetical protein
MVPTPSIPYPGLMLWTVRQWLLGNLSAEKLAQQTWLLRAWVFAAPLGYIAGALFSVGCR